MTGVNSLPTEVNTLKNYFKTVNAWKGLLSSSWIIA